MNTSTDSETLALAKRLDEIRNTFLKVSSYLLRREMHGDYDPEIAELCKRLEIDDDTIADALKYIERTNEREMEPECSGE